MQVGMTLPIAGHRPISLVVLCNALKTMVAIVNKRSLLVPQRLALLVMRLAIALTQLILVQPRTVMWQIQPTSARQSLPPAGV
jgi:hypothetical protein